METTFVVELNEQVTIERFDPVTPTLEIFADWLKQNDLWTEEHLRRLVCRHFWKFWPQVLYELRCRENGEPYLDQIDTNPVEFPLGKADYRDRPHSSLASTEQPIRNYSTRHTSRLKRSSKWLTSSDPSDLKNTVVTEKR